MNKPQGNDGDPPAPASIGELRDALLAHPRILALGGGSKWTRRRTADGIVPISTAAFRGITEYQPDEYTISARSGTPLREVEAALQEHGQFLPFDPPFAADGATLGGAVATGLSGSGSQRHGQMRDFILAVQLMTGNGSLIRGGARVVKNSAGFDLPKLVVGSLGRFGILTEITFKVFPAPAAVRHLRVHCPDLNDAVARIIRLNRSHLVLDALDLEPPGTLHLTLAGQADSLVERVDRLGAFLDREVSNGEPDLLNRRMAAPPAGDGEGCRVKLALTPSAIPAIDRDFRAAGARTLYTFGGATGWVAWPGNASSLISILNRHQLTGMVFRGDGAPHLAGGFPGAVMADRIRHALDPDDRFPGLPGSL
ncbi:MAG: FAD-binding protein [Opitutaceae bacterium]